MLAKVTAKGQICIPQNIRKKFGIVSGDYVDFSIEENRIMLIPQVMLDKSQAYFWTKEWQQHEKEAEDDKQNYKIKSFDDVDEALKWLDE
ncbi:AbrB/MazE/SpoVT family DNA-binding domain-containing protein [bacterium]|nr:AbrB/MazE/SpoVT family DNA-binding domain-containing protein [bacterium]